MYWMLWIQLFELQLDLRQRMEAWTAGKFGKQ